MSHKRAKRGRKATQLDPLNDPNHWDTDINPPYFDTESFQARINDRVGRNRDGKPIIRLIWAPKSIGLWDVPRYMLSRVKNGEGWLYTTIKRWVLESRLEREQYVDSWNASRYGMTEPAETDEKCENCGSIEKPVDVYGVRRCSLCGSDQLVRGEAFDKGAPPDEFFKWEWTCATHEAINLSTGQPHCCERAYKDEKKRCFGLFRNPNDSDLDLLSAAVRRRDAEKFINPYAPLSAQDLTAIEMSSGVQVERMIAAQEARQAEIVRNERALSDRGGTFHDVGFSRKQNSLIYSPN